MDLRRAALLAPAVVACVGGFLFAYSGTDFSLDDAWIHMAYARSLKLGEGLSYNPHDWETGFSSPLWVLALTILPWLGHPLVAVKTLGVLLHGVAASLAAVCGSALAKLTTKGGRPALAGLLSGLLVAVHPGLLQSAVSGMEVTLATVLVIALANLAIPRERGTRPTWLVALVAGACVLTRPEHLYFTVALGILFFVQQRTLRALAPAAGGIAGMAIWVIYCLLVTGYPLPNSHYVKSAVAGLRSVQYLAVDVLLSEPWVVSIAGILLMMQALRLDRERGTRILSSLLLAWLAALLATAASRHLQTGILFFHWRYLGIFMAVPLLLIGVPLSLAPKRWLYAAALLTLVVSVAFLPGRRALVRAQERNIRLLHTEPALTMARTLPADSVVLVEGAGASRFFTPRTMRIVDALGLNDHLIAHGKDSIERICRIYRLEPTHLLLPDELMGGLGSAFSYEVLQQFREPAYAQTIAVGLRSVFLCGVHGNRPAIEARCAQ